MEDRIKIPRGGRGSSKTPVELKTITIPLVFAQSLVDHLRDEGHEFMAEDLVKYMGDNKKIPGIEFIGKSLDDFFINAALKGDNHG